MSEDGVKDDKAKPPIFRGVLVQFPRAMESLAALSAFGANKYSWENWKIVPDRLERYSNAMVRHLIAEAKGEILDAESGFPHAWSTAWNALARLEIMMEEQNAQSSNSSSTRE